MEHQSEEQKVCEQSSCGQAADERAQKIIKNHLYGAVGVGLIPVPMVDLISLTAIQLNMLKQLADLYEIPYKKELGKAAIGTLAASVTPAACAAPIASIIKLVPFIGYTTSALTLSLTGGATTYAVGKVFNQHFASGGTFLDFDPKKVREYFAEKFEEGKLLAKRAKSAGSES